MQGVEARSGSLQSLGASFVGISADTPEVLRKLAKDLKLSFTLASDPQLTCAKVLGVPTFAKHIKAGQYPRKAFLQPAVFIFGPDATERFRWVMKPKWWNLFGAARRMTVDDIIKKAGLS